MRDIETMVFHADWTGLGRRAGPIRNEQIIANADLVVAFRSGNSRGTLNTIALAARAGLPVEIFGLEGQPIDVGVALDVAERLGVIVSIEASEARQHLESHRVGGGVKRKRSGVQESRRSELEPQVDATRQWLRRLAA